MRNSYACLLQGGAHTKLSSPCSTFWGVNNPAGPGYESPGPQKQLVLRSP